MITSDLHDPVVQKVFQPRTNLRVVTWSVCYQWVMFQAVQLTRVDCLIVYTANELYEW